MEVKIIVIIISLIIVVGIILTTLNKKQIKNALGKKSCDTVVNSEVMGYETGGNQAMIQEELKNIRRENGREKSHPDPNATQRSDICNTDACHNCDPYHKQLKIMCDKCNN